MTTARLRLSPALNIKSDHVGLAILGAREQLVRFGIVAESWTGIDGQFVSAAIADIRQVAEGRAQIGIRDLVVQILVVPGAASRDEILHVLFGAIAARSALGTL